MEGIEKFEVKQNVHLHYFGSFIAVLYNHWYIVLAYRLFLTCIEIICSISKSLLCVYLHLSTYIWCCGWRLSHS